MAKRKNLIESGSTAGVGILATFPGTEGPDSYHGGAENDYILGLGGNDSLWGGAGNDSIIAGAGDDQLYGEDGNDDLYGQDGNDTILGGLGADYVNAGKGTDSVDGGAGNDYIGGLEGADRLFGGDGDDHVDGLGNYEDSQVDLTLDGNDYIDGGAGRDTVMGAGGDDTVLGGDGDDRVFGDRGAGFVSAGIGNDYLDGGAGNDSIEGGGGNDSIFGGSENDAIYGDFNAADPANGPYLNQFGDDWVNAGDGNDSIWGGGGNDTLLGGTGNDIARGEAGADAIDGDLGNDTLDGGIGVDNMTGREGNDIYWVDETADIASEFQKNSTVDAGGRDRVKSTATEYTLWSYIEELELIEGSKALKGTGNDQNNWIIGNSNNNVIDGGKGADVMQGGAGDDTYYVDNTMDMAVEKSGEGHDTVIASVDCYLWENNEDLRLVEGTTAVVGFGSTQANHIWGNSNANVIRGWTLEEHLHKSGIDTLEGGAGDDIYGVDDTSDVIIERPDEGTEMVHAWADYTLSANLEHLDLWDGSGAHYGAGNELDNSIISNANGDDTLVGAGGNDSFVVHNEGDIVVEAAGGGERDEVFSWAVSYTLAEGSEIEALHLYGDAISGTGNSFNNAIEGNGNNNILNGGRGDDYLRGDREDEGTRGADTFVFEGTDFGWDQVLDFNAADGDVINFKGAFASFDEVLAKAQEYTDESGVTSTIIALDDHNGVGLFGVAKASLTADAFVFI